MSVLIHSVESVLTNTHKGPDTTIVMAKGKVNTGGWSDIALRLKQPAPKDLRIHLEFVGTKPTGAVTQAFVDVQASLEVIKTGKIGITVYAANNMMHVEF